MIQGLEKTTLQGDIQQAQHAPLQQNREDPSPGAPAEMSEAQTAQAAQENSDPGSSGGQVSQFPAYDSKHFQTRQKGPEGSAERQTASRA